ncbi:hypothetical protein [Methylocaldum sp.]|uniref:hypothetical protein n=1 Tax=Methylocaldum sp. TaxID=1969727 RepID=UPI002D372637|nr:hypothetical protein [Methylocaldum sp.]HYE38206.1 hypothetical protein [Methylocaldum sp.]
MILSLFHKITGSFRYASFQRKCKREQDAARKKHRAVKPWQQIQQDRLHAMLRGDYP